MQENRVRNIMAKKRISTYEDNRVWKVRCFGSVAVCITSDI